MASRRCGFFCNARPTCIKLRTSGVFALIGGVSCTRQPNAVNGLLFNVDRWAVGCHSVVCCCVLFVLFDDLLGAVTCAATEFSVVLLSVSIGRGPMTLGH